MEARDVMQSNVMCAAPDDTISDVATKMSENHISGMPVVDAEDGLVGMVSEGDLIRRTEIGTEPRSSWWLGLLSSDGERARDYVKARARTVKDVMSKDIHVVAEDADISEIAELMERNRIKRIPVVSEGKLVGLVSRADLVRALASKPKSSPRVHVEDRELRKRVQDAISEEPLAQTAQLNITVEDGTVYLWGTVQSRQQADVLRILVENVDGVGKVVEKTFQIPAQAYI